MNRLALAALILATSTAAIAQSGERRFEVGRFDAVELTGSDAVRVVPGAAFSVTASGDPRAVAALTVDVRGNTLRVGRRPGNWRDKGAVVTVTMPAIRGATITGSGDLDVGRVAGAAFAGKVGGSGDLRLHDVRVRDARIEVGGSGNVTLDGNVAGVLAIDLSGSGDVVARGNAGNVAVRLVGSGDIDTSAVRTARVQVDLSGSGDVKTFASDTARVAAGGTGDVTVAGHPRCTVRKTGTADVSCG